VVIQLEAASFTVVASSPSAEITEDPGCFYDDEDDEISDPFESFNRVMFVVNGIIDNVVVLPVAMLYKHVAPKFLQIGIENFVSNTFGPIRSINFALQGNGQQMAKTIFRSVFNFVFGFFGLFDPAKRIGITSEDTDFGQTLKKWGARPGPFIVLPVLGPSSMRGLVGGAVTIASMPSAQLAFLSFPKKTRTKILFSAKGTEMLIARAKLIDLAKDLKNLYDDHYVGIRSAIMSRETNSDWES
jgi:phospholipid-binding lipoprotein MlaA